MRRSEIAGVYTQMLAAGDECKPPLTQYKKRDMLACLCCALVT